MFDLISMITKDSIGFCVYLMYCVLLQNNDPKTSSRIGFCISVVFKNKIVQKVQVNQTILCYECVERIETELHTKSIQSEKVS